MTSCECFMTLPKLLPRHNIKELHLVMLNFNYQTGPIQVLPVLILALFFLYLGSVCHLYDGPFWLYKCYTIFVLIVCLDVQQFFSHIGAVLSCRLSFVALNCVFVTLPCGILGQVWYLIVLILCPPFLL